MANMVAVSQMIVGEAFDTEAVIAEFLADRSQTSLRLPHMTTGQRKRARKLAEVHPEITCESLGLGAERQLHLFKMSSAVVAQVEAPVATVEAKNAMVGAEVTVKNTCINPVAADGDRSPENVDGSAAFRSTPHLGAHACLAAGHQLAVPLLPLKGSQLEGDCSTRASSAELSSSERSPTRSSSNEFQVRNTFIHCGASEDPRDVRSMPHGMFRQSLLAEAEREAAASAQAVAARVQEFPVGSEIMVQGLVQMPAFNGQIGVVKSLDEDGGRYEILLTMLGGRQQQAKVKGENLRLVW